MSRCPCRSITEEPAPAGQERRRSRSPDRRAVMRVLRTLLVFENTPDPIRYPESLVACAEHTQLAREAAEKSMVLIKNEGGVLPFDKNVKRVLVLGRLAAQENTGDHGSSNVTPPYVITPLEGLKRYFGPGVEILHRDEAQSAEARQLAQESTALSSSPGTITRRGGTYCPRRADDLMKWSLPATRTWPGNQGHVLKATRSPPVLKCRIKTEQCRAATDKSFR